MKIVFFVHPSFLAHQSMPRFANLLSEGMKARKHDVEIWEPKPLMYKLPLPKFFKKWLGYIDQYILFPIQVKHKIKKYPSDTLFAFTDHALGPWVPLVSHRPHAIHCHDFLAQRSALGKIAENPTGMTGRIYQRYIRNGYSKGANFISVSEQTREELNEFLDARPNISKVVYNGLNRPLDKQDPQKSRQLLSHKTGIDLKTGYILHIGGNQWYKNREGVVKIYNAWRKSFTHNLPLLLIGADPDESLKNICQESEFKSDIHLLTDIEDDLINGAYSGASAFLFPSLAEGFGWPIAEAMACGCPVITTQKAPMTEVGGNAAYYVSNQTTEDNNWPDSAAIVLNDVINLPDTEREKVIEAGIINARRFDPQIALDQIEAIYKEINKQ